MVFPRSGVDRATPVFHLKQQIPEGREFLLGRSTLIQRRALVCPLQYVPEFIAGDEPVEQVALPGRKSTDRLYEICTVPRFCRDEELRN